ncbi:Hypothetical protein NTJ_16301 [Nesidiocoris tenuis]|nr:Hypothetical protein NTJ_16301 [Nesidiocoris tenuis]
MLRFRGSGPPVHRNHLLMESEPGRRRSCVLGGRDDEPMSCENGFMVVMDRNTNDSRALLGKGMEIRRPPSPLERAGDASDGFLIWPRSVESFKLGAAGE